MGGSGVPAETHLIDSCPSVHGESVQDESGQAGLTRLKCQG